MGSEMWLPIGSKDCFSCYPIQALAATLLSIKLELLMKQRWGEREKLGLSCDIRAVSEGHWAEIG